jgi:hypothetical protein
MALRRVPGSRHYQADDDGLREIGQSAAMGAEMLSVGQRIAGNAEAVGSGNYRAEAATVTVGWQNERRRGAVVRESRHEWRDWRDAILVRVLASMAISRGSPPESDTDMVTYTRRDGKTRQATRAQANAWMNSRLENR